MMNLICKSIMMSGCPLVNSKTKQKPQEEKLKALKAVLHWTITCFKLNFEEKDISCQQKKTYHVTNKNLNNSATT